MGILSNFNNSNLHNNPPIIVSSIGSNFINNISAGYFNGNKDYPTNIHWNHLDDFGSLQRGVGGMFDYNKDGTINSTDSYQSCPACHNVHGTNYPMMTKNALAIRYGSDSNGTFGYIESDAYLSSGGDIYCNGCHTSGTTFKYYRNKVNLYQDCISCHFTDMTKDFNKTAFSQGVHVDINTANGIGSVNNSDCWTCHYKKDMNRSNIYSCINCHVQAVVPSAPSITSHKPEKTNKSSCEACHELVKLDPGLNRAGQQYPNITAHYAQLPSVPTPKYCDYCHGPDAFSSFQAPYRNITSFYHNSSNASFPGNSTCRTCHTRTDVPADPLANNNSNFHNLTTEYGDVKNETVVANCMYCHIDHDARFSTAPSPSHNTSGMVLDDCYLCHGTKVIGTNAQKLHDVRSYVTTGCIPCHVDLNDVNKSMFGRHKNLNETGGLDNLTDDDCNTCHFGGRTGDLPMIPGGANRNNTYECGDCHQSAGAGSPKPTQTNLLINTFKHASNKCISCHAPDFYHLQGTVGPLGRVENPGWQLISPIDNTGCHDCHRTHNGLDEPFHGPGIGAPGPRHIATNSKNNGSDCSSTCHTSNTNPHNVKSSTNTYKPTLSTPALSPSTGNSVEVITTGSSVSTSASLHIEAAQYRIYNSTGKTIVDWTAMNAKDGRFNSSLETVNATINTMGFPEGTYTVSVRVMASGPRTNTAIRYYPLNGDWSAPLNATLVIEPPNGYVNGTVNDSLSGSGIPGVTVTTNTGVSANTDSAGFYSLGLKNGTYTLTAIRAPEYYPNTTIPPVTVTALTTVTRDIIMTKKPTGTISGVVTSIN
ncbi:MAG: carboxypeptidase-like regulatory domain-containing protein [Euryarchaeota archaeon]|nr:carboxypeptidase-like regulatory domain-containing protein [Euryarchaeota archaeon]